MDYFESLWNEHIDECVRNLELAMVVAGTTMPVFAGDLNTARVTMNNIRDIPQRYDEHIERIDLDVISESMRDSVVAQVALIIRTLQASKDEVIYQVEQLQYLIAGVGPR